jgi:hypothetical protein
MNEQIEQWIPWYVNGTLGANERAEMDRYLASNAEARAEIALLRKTAATLKKSANRVPADRGLHEVLARIHAEKTTRHSAAKSTSSTKNDKSTGFFESFRAWLGTSWTQPAFALALVVIGAQSMFLMRDAPDAMLMRGAAINTTGESKNAAANMAYLRVGFKPTATEGEIRVLLAGSNANFASGPGDDGAYTITVADKDAVRALEVFKGSNIVAVATSSLPPR